LLVFGNTATKFHVAQSKRVNFLTNRKRAVLAKDCALCIYSVKQFVDGFSGTCVAVWLEGWERARNLMNKLMGS
jgi:hypothetical protein